VKNIFEYAARTALTGLAIFGFASAAFAHHAPQQPFIEEESLALLNVVRATGHRVYLDQGPCLTEKGLMGFATSTGALVICTKAHGDDMDELADTIRHEAFHLAQFCKGRKAGTPDGRGLTILPELEDQNIEIAQEVLHWHILGYEPGKWATEAEARVVAHALEEEQIAAILVDECGVK